MANTYVDNRDAIIAYVDALIVITPDLNIGNAARDYCKDNLIPATTEDIDDLVSQIVRNKQEAEAEAVIERMVVKCSDEATALVATVAKYKFPWPVNATLTEVRGRLNVAPTDTGSPLSNLFTVDINQNVGNSPEVESVLSTKLTFDVGEKTTMTAATAAVISNPDLIEDAEISIDIDDADADGTAAGLTITFLFTIP